MGNKATATIRAGVCGFVTRVRAEGGDDFLVRLAIASDCAKVRAFGEELAASGTVNALDEISKGAEGVILTTAGRHLMGCCAACVAADGVFKAMQVAGGMALPAPVSIDIQRADEG